MAEPTFDKSTLAWTLTWDADWVTAVSFIGSTRKLAAGNNLGQVVLWDLPEKAGGDAPKPIRRLDGHSNVISRLTSTRDGKYLVSSSYDHSIRIWDMSASTKGSEDMILNARAIAYAEERKRNGAKVPAPMPAKVELQSAAHVVDLHKEWVSNFSFSADEKLVLSGDDGGEVILWNFAERKEIKRWKTKGWVYALALSPDAKQALISERKPLVFDSGRQAAINLWNVEKGEAIKDLAADFKDMYIGAAAYSLDGKVLAIGRGGEAAGMNGKVWLLNAADGKKIKELSPPHQDGVTDIVFHPDGKHVASCGRDTVIRIWSIADGKLVKELGKGRGGQFKDWICSVAFSADGKWLAGADMAGAVQVWSLD
jgi:WD40 repeat protein